PGPGGGSGGGGVPPAPPGGPRRPASPTRLGALGTIVRERLPGRERADVDVAVRPLLERGVDRAQADARELRVRPAAPEQVRPAHRAERLRRALLGLVGADELVSGKQTDPLRPDPPARRADAARD